MTTELDGQVGQKEIRNHWANLYEQQFYLSPKTIQKNSDELNNLIGRKTDTCSFDFADIVKALTKLSLKKSTGLDGIRAEHFIFSCHYFFKYFFNIINSCFSHSFLPSSMLKVYIKPILKKKGLSCKDSNNYRPIAIATTASKIVEYLILCKFSKELRAGA